MKVYKCNINGVPLKGFWSIRNRHWQLLGEIWRFQTKVMGTEGRSLRRGDRPEEDGTYDMRVRAGYRLRKTFREKLQLRRSRRVSTILEIIWEDGLAEKKRA